MRDLHNFVFPKTRMSSVGLYWGTEGYNVYKDMHHSTVNRALHAIGMPFVVYAVLYGLTAKLTSTSINAYWARFFIYLTYLFYYIAFDPFGAVLTGIFYLPAIFYYPYKHYTRQCSHSTSERNKIFTFWTLVAFSTIFVQEFIGHWFFEEKGSDLSVFPTSVTISPLFGVRCLFGIA